MLHKKEEENSPSSIKIIQKSFCQTLIVKGAA